MDLQKKGKISRARQPESILRRSKRTLKVKIWPGRKENGTGGRKKAR